MDARLSKIYKAAEDIAGAILEDDDATPDMKLSYRINRASNWRNMGTDGDLNPSDRETLRALAAEAKKIEKEIETEEE